MLRERSRSSLRFRLVPGCAVLAIAWASPAFAQGSGAQIVSPAPSSTEMTPAERARRDADNVYRWILIHADKPRKPTGAKDEKPAAPVKAKSAPRPDGKPDEPAPAAAPAIAAAGAAVGRPAEESERSVVKVVPDDANRDVRIAPERPKATSAAPPESTSTTTSLPPMNSAPSATPSASVISAPSVDGVPSTSSSPSTMPAPSPGLTPSTTLAPLTTLAPSVAEPAKAEAVPPQSDARTATVAIALPKASATPSSMAVAPAAAPVSPPAATSDDLLKPLSRIEPKFPMALMRSLRHGEVKVGFKVSPDGTVSETNIVSTTHPGLNSAAQAAVLRWRFAPLQQAEQGAVELAFELD